MDTEFGGGCSFIQWSGKACPPDVEISEQRPEGNEKASDCDIYGSRFQADVETEWACAWYVGEILSHGITGGRFIRGHVT